MAFFDTKKPLSFGGIQVPFKTYRVRGGIRKHVHEYPHTPAGALEKLGRSLYEVQVSVDFADQLDSPKYTDMITRLGILRGFFEGQETLDLHIPHIGTFKACADEWTEEATGSNRSTVKADFKFVEDSNSGFLVLDTITVTPGALPARIEQFQIEVEKQQERARIGQLDTSQPSSSSSESIFSQIDKAANAVLATFDQMDLYGSLVASKVEGLVNLCSQADQAVKSLNDPVNHELLEALHRLWEMAQQIRRDIQQRDEYLRHYTVPIRMTVGQAAAAIYGDASRGAELMQLNVIEDPLSLEPGTSLRYYDTAA